jgi:hypothetical protein
MKFKELKFRTHAENDVQAWTKQGNYEVSIIRNALSHGGDKGLYEIGVYLAGTNKMCDPLGWGDDVKGWLKPEDVEKELDLIASL